VSERPVLSQLERKWGVYILWDVSTNQMDTLPVWFSPKISRLLGKDAFPGVPIFAQLPNWQMYAKKGNRTPRVGEGKW
jgi:hypothetical protein